MAFLKGIIIFLIFLTLFSCNNKKKENIFNKSRDTKSNILDKGFKKNLFKISEDTTLAKFYDGNGQLVKEGKFLYDTLKIGIWSFYEGNKLKSRREYLDYQKSEYLNQFWLFDENEEIVGGSFYEINDFESEYNLGEEIMVEIFTPYKYFSDLDSELFLIYSTDDVFKQGITNRNEIKYDTIWNARKSYPSQFEENDDRFNLFFAIEPEKTGRFKASCILIEQAEDFTEKDSMIRYREMFFEIDFKVKDTSDSSDF